MWIQRVQALNPSPSRCKCGIDRHMHTTTTTGTIRTHSSKKSIRLQRSYRSQPMYNTSYTAVAVVARHASARFQHTNVKHAETVAQLNTLNQQPFVPLIPSSQPTTTTPPVTSSSSSSTSSHLQQHRSHQHPPAPAQQQQHHHPHPHHHRTTSHLDLPLLPDGHPDYLRMILNARVYDVAIESPLQYAASLSKRMGNNILLKREDLQPVFSFKLRGAYNKISHLSAEEKARGVITCSAGNHAQGVALAAKKLNIKATIVMPHTTPTIKINAVRQIGGDDCVVLHGDDFDTARAECDRLAEVTGQVIVHPFDDPYVIAGQGTISMEIVRQAQKMISNVSANESHVNYIFCGVGGGGLIAGVAAYVKNVRPDIKIIAVETHDANALDASLRSGQRVVLPEVGLFADGAAVRQVGKENFRLAQKYVDDLVLVSTDDICAAIRDIFNETRSIMEPAGALGLAGLKKYIREHNLYGKNLTFAVVTSGANMSFARLRWVSDRGESVDSLPDTASEVLMAATIPEKPGSFLKLVETLYPRNTTEFSYRYADGKKAHIFVAFQVIDRNEIQSIISKLKEHDMTAIDISHDDLARNHMRYLAAGRAANIDAETGAILNAPKNERIYRFEFPERPGALLKFLRMLQTMRGTNVAPWNVSMFHYRNYGGDVASILCSIQVDPSEEEQWQAFLKTLNYRYTEESSNPLYRLFIE
jgi:threonine dehydratase